MKQMPDAVVSAFSSLQNICEANHLALLATIIDNRREHGESEFLTCFMCPDEKAERAQHILLDHIIELLLTSPMLSSGDNSDAVVIRDLLRIVVRWFNASHVEKHRTDADGNYVW